MRTARIAESLPIVSTFTHVTGDASLSFVRRFDPYTCLHTFTRNVITETVKVFLGHQSTRFPRYASRTYIPTLGFRLTDQGVILYRVNLAGVKGAY